MTNKERVYSALRHERPDRVPRFIWLGNGVIESMTRELGMTPLALDVHLKNDILQTWVSINREMARELSDGASFTDEWGITWKREGFHNMVTSHPLGSGDADFISEYPLPDPYHPSRYEALKDLLSKYGESHFIGADVSGSLFEPAYHLRGMEDLLMDLAMENDEAVILLDRLEDFTTKVALECVRLGVDWIWLGDDMGTQNGMIMSPSMWREVFKPRMKRIIAAIKAAKPGIFVAYHSCGSMSPIIPDLVEIGVDVLNPLQESAKDMDHAAVKRSFEDRITLMCGLDTQTFLIEASANEVRTKTREKIETLGYNGGFIFAASHHIQHDTPKENIDALFHELDKE